MIGRMKPAIASLAVALALFSALPCPALAGQKSPPWPPGAVITGSAVALDGDTIRVFPPGPEGATLVNPEDGWVDVRLWGIDAPEMTAADGAGWAARKTMDSILVWQPVTCTTVDTDRYKRPVAVCVNDPNGDIGRLLIWSGWAVEYRKYTRLSPRGDARLAKTAAAYAEAESDAEHNRRGRWEWIFGD